MLLSLLFDVVSQVYNMFPRLFSWIKTRQLILKNVEMNIRDIKELITYLRETLNPNVCRGFVDCFLIRKQKEEVRLWLFVTIIVSTNEYLIMICLFVFFLGLWCYKYLLQRRKHDTLSHQPLWSRD